ncbi:hypothetical protein DXG03_005069 [Asterophora parasitica]|uniref:Uncharacterized protein n=1 Tax=Asterophora parasitica TaxID=117018 RepID=A0A9P7GEX4_9AGAR|nr:hypothetical protein DXG03_005069 [Asterophora parasitica]
MLVNAMLGTILWGTYAEAFIAMEPFLSDYSTLHAAMAGGLAGGVQALLAAPAENVRLVLEGGTGGSSWSKAWKEVFQGTKDKSISGKSDIEDIRQLRGWMKDVRGMAGRGWNGWGWGLGKDICGFAAFFSIFEVTRRGALQVKHLAQKLGEQIYDEDAGGKALRNQIPRIIHGVALISGGVGHLTQKRKHDVNRDIDIFKVFHEGLKSWSCCNDVYKPVLEFDEFMKIPGCAEADRHTVEAPKAELPKPTPATSFSVEDSGSGQEVYSTVTKQSISVPSAAPALALASVVEEEDDLKVSVAPGTTCRRTGCKLAFISDAANRQGDGEGTVCTYHPSPPLFREGSKGYLCCKRRVLEFDEFLKIEGCKTGRHLFSPLKTTPAAEELTTCRVDHYQTVDQVHVSVFGKKADKERSAIVIEETKIKLDLYLPGPKRFTRTLDLFGPIDPGRSSYQFFGTKVELHLQKRDGRSWTVLEKTIQDLGNISLTFGVGGRTGTVGAKHLVLDDINKARV